VTTSSDADRWTVSSFCDLNGCVEVGRYTDGRVAVRDTKDRSRPALVFTPMEWTAFVHGVRAGEFDF
jgi:hypothetical protein